MVTVAYAPTPTPSPGTVRDVRPSANSGRVVGHERAAEQGGRDGVSVDRHDSSPVEQVGLYDAQGRMAMNEAPSRESAPAEVTASAPQVHVSDAQYGAGPKVLDRYELTRQIYEKLFGSEVAERLDPSAFEDQMPVSPEARQVHGAYFGDFGGTEGVLMVA